MTDIRRIRVETREIKEYEIDVEKWFDEFLSEWLEYDNTDGYTVEELREEFIKETAYELAMEDSYGYESRSEKIIWDDYEIEVDIYRK